MMHMFQNGGKLKGNDLGWATISSSKNLVTTKIGFRLHTTVISKGPQLTKVEVPG